jgi:heptosyltransferase-1
LLHGTSRADKHWPVESWIELGRKLEEHGLVCVLPWGSEEERACSERIAASLQRATIPDRMMLDQVALLLAGSALTVGVDTGLTHLAAALGRPVAAIFTGSDPLLTGVFGAARARNLGHAGANPEPAEVLAALADLKAL